MSKFYINNGVINLRLFSTNPAQNFQIPLPYALEKNTPKKQSLSEAYFAFCKLKLTEKKKTEKKKVFTINFWLNQQHTGTDEKWNPD